MIQAKIYNLNTLTKIQPITQNNITHRNCTGCNTTKPLVEFHFKNRGKYGRNSRCAVCISGVNKSRIGDNTKRKNPVIASSKTINPKLSTMNVTKTSMFNPFNINQLLDKHPDSELKASYLAILKHTIGSPTGYFAKEEMVATVLDLFHCKDINGPDAYDNDALPCEIKTNSITMISENSKATFGGSFNDFTEHKLKDVANYKMAVGVFVDHYLLAIATFPGNWPPFYNRLERELRKNVKGRVCSTFHYNDWKDCPEMKWDVIPDVASLIKFKSKLSKVMYDDIQEAQTCAMEEARVYLTSRSDRVNIKYE